MRRVKELDGIRGIAILLVLMTHLNGLLFLGLNTSFFHKAAQRVAAVGWVGVDIFFVLSGYLITSILLKRDPPEYFWKAFYLRRGFRIIPAFLVVFGITLLLIPPVSKRVVMMYILFVGNWTILGGQEIEALSHLWSLAIEEQFYLFWPAVVRRLEKKTVIYVALTIALLSIALRAVLYAKHVNAYVSTR